MPYISVCKWRDFQHYKDRWPPWIKNNTDLMANDDYLDLSSHLRGVLHSLWLEYASARCHLELSTSKLSRRLGLRVMRRDIDALVQAGFLAIVDSAELAEGYQDARGVQAFARSQEAYKTTETEPKAVSEAIDKPTAWDEFQLPELRSMS